MKATQLTAALAAATLSAVLSIPAEAGKWGRGYWGHMVWGEGRAQDETTPGAPGITATSDGESITVTITNYTGEQAGWSAITGYTVDCEGVDAVSASVAAGETTTITVTGLESDTGYNCSVYATNDIGNSASTDQLVTTESGNTGLPIWLLYCASGGNCSAS